MWLPTLRLLVLKVATPEPLRGTAAAIVVAPSLKSTVPPGVPEPGATALTVAVNVVDWPKTVGLTELVRSVEVLALVTVCVAVPELELKLASPG